MIRTAAPVGILLEESRFGRKLNVVPHTLNAVGADGAHFMVSSRWIKPGQEHQVACRYVYRLPILHSSIYVSMLVVVVDSVPHRLICRFSSSVAFPRFVWIVIVLPAFRSSVGRRPRRPSAHGSLPRRCPAGQGDYASTRVSIKSNENACALRCSSFTLESSLASCQRYASCYMVPPCRAERVVCVATTLSSTGHLIKRRHRNAGSLAQAGFIV